MRRRENEAVGADAGTVEIGPALIGEARPERETAGVNGKAQRRVGRVKIASPAGDMAGLADLDVTFQPHGDQRSESSSRTMLTHQATPRGMMSSLKL